MFPTQARKMTNIEGLGIFDLEENKVDIIDDNLLPQEEVEEALEDAEAPEGTGNLSWPRNHYGIENEGTNDDTRANPQSRDT